MNIMTVEHLSKSYGEKVLLVMLHLEWTIGIKLV